jgi:hypothetical protein
MKNVTLRNALYALSIVRGHEEHYYSSRVNYLPCWGEPRTKKMRRGILVKRDQAVSTRALI